jgi:hypothetical protein
MDKGLPEASLELGRIAPVGNGGRRQVADANLLAVGKEAALGGTHP